MEKKFHYVRPEILDLGTDAVQAAMVSVDDTTGIFDEREKKSCPVPGWQEEQYVPWGDDNLLPLKIRDLVGSDEVTSENKLFNVLTCYGAGIQLQDEDGDWKKGRQSHPQHRGKEVGTPAIPTAVFPEPDYGHEVLLLVRMRTYPV